MTSLSLSLIDVEETVEQKSHQTQTFILRDRIIQRAHFKNNRVLMCRLPYDPSAGVTCGRDGSVDNHMEMGKKLLAAGQLADALSHFHAAVGKDAHTLLLLLLLQLQARRRILFFLSF